MRIKKSWMILFIFLTFFSCKKKQIEIDVNSTSNDFLILDNQDLINEIEVSNTEENCFAEFSFVESDYSLEKQFYEKYGNLYINYIKKNCSFESYGVSYFPITSVEYCYKEADVFYKLGTVNLDGIYDKDNNLICDCPLDIEKDGIEGYSSELLTDPFYLAVYISKNGKQYLLDPYAVLKIDFDNDSLSAISMKDVIY